MAGSVVVWISIPKSVVQQITCIDEGVERHHVTLTYHSSTDEFEKGSELLKVVRKVAKKQSPFEIVFSGLAIFNNHLKDMNPVVALVNSHDLIDFRRELTDAMGDEGIYYFDSFIYTPHMTLEYFYHGDGYDVDVYQLNSIREASYWVEKIKVKIGNKSYNVRLGEGCVS